MITRADKLRVRVIPRREVRALYKFSNFLIHTVADFDWMIGATIEAQTSMDFPPRFSRSIAIAFFVLSFIVIGAPRARAAGFSDYAAAPFQSVATTFETVFAKLLALANHVVVRQVGVEKD